MLDILDSAVTPAVLERLTLAINHVLSGEPAATSRLQAHAGRTVEVAVSGWPSLLPAPPACTFLITRAGLLEWCGPVAGAAPDLVLRVDGSNPVLMLSRALGGTRPPVAVEGDAQLAGDVNWLLQNVRWDVAADLERVFGPVAAQQLQRIGATLSGAVRSAVAGLNQAGSRLRPRA